ncbi:NAD-glutamate dehydrogenase [Pacificimonas sp. WHA3]|uniref:NAD-glutamate dehydrogenase n=1 Tax=Pacificimonas pallii TaxID=2827236 RepID=A0ABS6SHS4_9SPHN|nr:NAD-glutamate dehydrogenase [Pacificimonas pallii]MBV7257402.1 NAD-glutamate dehydrogenase [Pacificimonas pallii]
MVKGRKDPLERALFEGALPGEADELDAKALKRITGQVRGALKEREAGTTVIQVDSIEPVPGHRRTGLVVVNDDMPFLVDSVTNALTARGMAIHRLLHPILDVQRTKGGRLKSVEAANGDATDGLRESLIYVEADRIGARGRADLAKELTEVLADVRSAVTDWRAMVAAMQEAGNSLVAAKIPASAGEVIEAKAFLDWLAADNFTLLGFAAYRFDGALADETVEPVVEASLGLLSDPDFPLWRGAGGFEVLPSALREFMATPDPILITKANAISRVHRATYYDVISIKRYNDKGEVCGEYRFVGLLTSAALSTSPDDVPIMRRKIEDVRKTLGFDPKSHSGKALTHIIETFPRTDLFIVGADRLAEMARGMLSLLDRPRPRIFARKDPFDRYVSAIVYVPREAYNTGIRARIGAMLEDAFQARLARFDVELRSEGLARVQYYLGTTPGDVPTLNEASLNERLQKLVRGWDEALESELIQRLGGQRGGRLSLTHAGAFSASYRDQFDAVEAAADIERLSDLDGEGDRDVLFYRRAGDADHTLRIKIYRAGKIIPLSDMVPVLEAFGFRVIEEYPFDLHGGRHGWIHDFFVESTHGEALDLDFLKVQAESALRAVLTGARENDAFNSLVTGASLRVEHVTWLRAYFRYLRQTGLTYGMPTVVEALRRHPKLTADLIGLFYARFDPAQTKRDAEIKAREKAIAEKLRHVAAIDEDRIIRLYRDVIDATLRTNAFAEDAEALAFKFDSAAIPGLPQPVPYREIWVYSPRVEGIHLRGGPIARGGLRWSDRRDDFRTEVLGLVKAQMVKNAVIVPTGSKGGFYPKQLPPISDREAWLAEGIACYRIFIGSLLSLTDNRVGDKTVPPKDVVCRDDPDPYLVVAADKGTATFSDIANEISVERGFWLGDAFASGGANGYDHKAMGITARGAWVSVERHFREMGVDVQSDVVTVVGVGDMSGDVFGNGMLLSESLKLVAAFDHRHIFVDPDPDPAKSFAERARLFALPRSSWEDYDPKLISKGGGVFPRAQKSIKLSPQICELLEIDEKEVAPSTLMKAILRANVDLLWFGGIGTYIKAGSESDADVGDRANDEIRVDAREVRVKVIGEGANLGITQHGRIAFARGGGRVNTDFIDNSAGVDCSDNEVNIKIALQEPLRTGALDMEARNKLLASMTDAVAALVLRDNHMQTQALSVAEAGGPAALPAFQRVIQLLEARGRLNRAVEHLPTDEQLTQRAAAGFGLTRPELSVILAYAKTVIYEALVASDVPDDPVLAEDLSMAFPDALEARFAPEIAAHTLRREIIATKLANQMVNRGGIALAFELAEEHGTTLAHVGSAFVAARELFGLRNLWRTIDAAEDADGEERIDAAAHIMLHAQSITGLRLHMSDLIRVTEAHDHPSDTITALKPGVDILASDIEALLRDEPRAHLERVRQRLSTGGAPQAISERLIDLQALDGAISTSRTAFDGGIDVRSVAIAYTLLGQEVGLDWAKAAAAQMNPTDPWERLLVAGLVRDFESLRISLIRQITVKGADPSAAVCKWLEQHKERADRMRTGIDRARNSGAVTTAMLAHLASQARSLLAI